MRPAQCAITQALHPDTSSSAATAVADAQSRGRRRRRYLIQRNSHRERRATADDSHPPGTVVSYQINTRNQRPLRPLTELDQGQDHVIKHEVLAAGEEIDPPHLR